MRNLVIAEAMVKAGMSEISGYDYDTDSLYDYMPKVYRAMMGAREI